ncbi:MAG: hypothetical protein AAGJ08_22965, partial [Cyanobacteria bacterium P01_H01_bin.35]
ASLDFLRESYLKKINFLPFSTQTDSDYLLKSFFSDRLSREAKTLGSSAKKVATIFSVKTNSIVTYSSLFV